MIESNVYIKKTNAIYCTNPPFHPNQKFPEHPNKFDSDDTNLLYEDFRDQLIEMGFDSTNFNTSKWNPFNTPIKPGQGVLLNYAYKSGEIGFV